MVHLFNTVEKHQKTVRSEKEMKAKRKQNLGAVKGSFMDILKSHSKRDQLLEVNLIKYLFSLLLL